LLKPILIILSSVVALPAFSSQYQNWISVTVQLDCKSTFQNQERPIVSTKEVNKTGRGDQQRVKSLEIDSVVQIEGKDFKRKYLVTSVMVDVLEDHESILNHTLRPTLIQGRHLKTGEKIEIKIDTNDSDEDGYSASDLIIGGKEQTYLKLECRASMAG
jgi:hypothetical protein